MSTGECRAACLTKWRSVTPAWEVQIPTWLGELQSYKSFWTFFEIIQIDIPKTGSGYPTVAGETLPIFDWKRAAFAASRFGCAAGVWWAATSRVSCQGHQHQWHGPGAGGKTPPHRRSTLKKWNRLEKYKCCESRWAKSLDYVLWEWWMNEHDLNMQNKNKQHIFSNSLILFWFHPQ